MFKIAAVVASVVLAIYAAAPTIVVFTSAIGQVNAAFGG